MELLFLAVDYSNTVLVAKMCTNPHEHFHEFNPRLSFFINCKEQKVLASWYLIKLIIFSPQDFKTLARSCRM